MNETGTPGERPPRAEVAETHTAIVFFAGDRAYKVKKAVDLGFLDYTEQSARRTACTRETVLNRRFAPDVYLGVGEVVSPGAEASEPLVVMRRMPADRRLSALVRAGADVDEVLRAVARRLSAWHAAAPHGRDVDEQGTRDALASRWEASFEQVRATTEDGADLEGLHEAERLVRRYLAGRRPLFDSRIEQRRVVDGHGDLLAEDIFCLDDGPRVLDCLEFDDHLRYVDGLDDAAFLAMDLEQLGAPEAAARFLARYSEYSGDPAPPSLRHHYVAYRAFVRAKVSLIQAAQGAPGARSASRRLLSATLRHLRTSAVGLTLVGGLPGSGKSTLSGALADRLGVTLLSSDRLRKELAGISPDTPAPAAYGEGLYTPEWTTRTYAALLDRAAALLSRGEPVVLDATWSTRELRARARRVAEGTRADLVALHCQVPGEVSAARLNTRSPGPSDADLGVATALAAREPPWPDAVTVDTSGPLESAVSHALAAVRPWGADQAPVFRRAYGEPDQD
ncbi:AAA family ATPase [Streptomyces caniscabiei]|uniref:AAA family ATPase n=1 Tax=Streptomyces caniscabiei TaxID=2746961 RepID=A0ABU4N2D3_9ACTN|nr:AAA family ATPase [Streptomyces caniscabiei]MDX2940517.1 AAA family ATPase [Streptomyces caniscabiei]MDX2954063.1 AAA family ATPase [Streptomyces caniscabiei]MDX2982848.1 AAA family ATPase [Streptomyces caniscabiei]MDX3013858.1 AAA family ATPase [Streptomyces caniscabiei]MDX3043673.1 AAA family ATPase [Streptomyces caniscabiei]